MLQARNNVVLFGESGAGKSSIVNMLMGEEVARAASDARGVTLDSQAFDFSIQGVPYRIHDTAGLNEGEGGRVPSRDAIIKLYKLLAGLGAGVSLLVFCIRAPRIKESAKFNWILFHEIICQKKVPIVSVITGLENEENMDSWWDREDNWDAFRKYEIQPAGHACITGTKGRLWGNEKYVFQDEYDESVAKVKKLIQRHRKELPWRLEKIEWFRNIYKTTYHSRCFQEPEKRMVLVDTVSQPADRLTEGGMSKEDATTLAKLLESAQKMNLPG